MHLLELSVLTVEMRKDSLPTVGHDKQPKCIRGGTEGGQKNGGYNTNEAPADKHKLPGGSK